MTALKRDRTTTADDVLDGISLRGHTIVVTGASSGVGRETARALAAHGATVVAAARDSDKGQRAADEIRSVHPDARLVVEQVDLSSLRSVRAFAERVHDRYEGLQGVIANAGLMAAPFGKTEDGFELQFGTNHLGHFLLVTELVDLLVAGGPSRAVILSSAAHRWADINLDDPSFERTPYDKYRAYGASKTANSLFAVEFDRRNRDKGVRAFAVHPGGVRTELARHLTADDRAGIEQLATKNDTFWKTVEQGAATSVWAALSPELDGRGGVYLENCQIAEVTDAEEVSYGVRSFALDAERAAALWSLSERLVGSVRT